MNENHDDDNDDNINPTVATEIVVISQLNSDNVEKCAKRKHNHDVNNDNDNPTVAEIVTISQLENDNDENCADDVTQKKKTTKKKTNIFLGKQQDNTTLNNRYLYQFLHFQILTHPAVYPYCQQGNTIELHSS